MRFSGKCDLVLVPELAALPISQQFRKVRMISVALDISFFLRRPGRQARLSQNIASSLYSISFERLPSSSATSTPTPPEPPPDPFPPQPSEPVPEQPPETPHPEP